MADQLSMTPEDMLSAAQFLANQADHLQDQLDNLTRDWTEVSGTWTGIAASSYQPPWDEWHDGAKVVTAVLHERSRLLTAAAALMVEHEAAASQQLRAVVQNRPTP